MAKRLPSDIVAVSAVRTPIGRFGGSLHKLHSSKLGAVSIIEGINRSGFETSDISEIFFGSCRQAGNGPNPARSAALFAGLPEQIPATTINMACPSAMKSMMLAASTLKAGDAQVMIAGGMDSMSTIPYLLKNARFGGFKMGNQTLEDGWSDSIDPTIGRGMGLSADILAQKHDVTRAAQDEYALESQRRTVAAMSRGAYKSEIVPVNLEPGDVVDVDIFETDQCPRPASSIERLNKLRPAFRDGGSVTAGNASSLADGSCAIVLTTRERAEAVGAKPLFSILSYADVGISPEYLGEGPGEVVPLALSKAGLSLRDMDLVEINEAFAVVVLVTERKLGIPKDKLNVNGGAIALGHPTGVSGARIVVTLAHALREHDKELAVAAVGGAGGVSTAMVIRRE